jgi:hypothetical protein
MRAHGGVGQPPPTALADQLGDRIAGPQKPRQIKFVWSHLADQRDDLPLLRFGQGGLFAWTAIAAPFGKPVPAVVPVAFDPPVDGIAVVAEHSRGLGLGHAVQHRPDGPLRSATCGAAGNDRVSSPAMPGAYDTITPFACRTDKPAAGSDALTKISSHPDGSPNASRAPAANFAGLGWWVPAETELGMVTVLADLGAELGLPAGLAPYSAR